MVSKKTSLIFFQFPRVYYSFYTVNEDGEENNKCNVHFLFFTFKFFCFSVMKPNYSPLIQKFTWRKSWDRRNVDFFVIFLIRINSSPVLVLWKTLMTKNLS